MKYVDEYRDADLGRALSGEILSLVEPGRTVPPNPTMSGPMLTVDSGSGSAGGSAGGWPGQRASRRWRLPPNPGARSTAKPAAARPRRTSPAAE